MNHPQGKRHVFQSSHVVEQATVLKDEAQGGAVGAQGRFVEGDGAAVYGHGARGRRLQAADDAQQRGLSTARGADDGECRYLLIEGDVAQDFYAVEGLAQMIEANAHGSPPGL